MDSGRARGIGRPATCAGRSRGSLGKPDAVGATTNGSQGGEEMTGPLALMLFVSPCVVTDVAKSKSDDQPAPAAKAADDLEKLREQIALDMQAVEKKLNEQDPGDATRTLQKQI